MKEPKPYLLTLVTIFLLISAGLLAATVYLYFHNPSQPVNTAQKNKTAINKNIPSGTRDSLQKIYSATIKDLDASFAGTPVNVTSIPENQPQSKTTDKSITDTVTTLQKLRSEINTILSDKASSADLESAKVKITELQELVNDLKNKNDQVIKENERLNAMLKLANSAPTKKMPGDKSNTGETTASNKASTSSLRAENFLVSATAETDFLEKETAKAAETDKLVGSFTLKNNGNQNSISEVMVVVVQPDGKVLQTSNWETGIFYTTAGKQIYSKKIRFNNAVGETKKLNFSLQAEKYLPGKYTIELYYEGSVIGRTTKTLS